jgi:hypothetical protein
MYYDDHNPPHFHAKYGEWDVQISIKELAIIKGSLPSRALGLVIEWASEHQKELKENWEIMLKSEKPKQIEPLA